MFNQYKKLITLNLVNRFEFIWTDNKRLNYSIT